MKDKLKRLLRRLRGRLLSGASAGGRGTNGRLTVCGNCGSHVVNPVDWHESDEAHWWVRLRCGACGGSREVTITDDEATQLERDLAPGLRQIATTVAGLDRERMLQEAEIFIAALERDLIGPADFARRLPR